MKMPLRAALAALVVGLLSAGACAPADDPELIGIAFVRATTSGDPDTAVSLIDIEQLTSRVEEEIVVVDSSGNESFLEDSIETLLWGLFRETRPAQYAYDTTPAETEGDEALVTVTKTSAEGTGETVLVHLRRTDAGWRVSGQSLDPMVRYVVTRLQEKY